MTLAREFLESLKVSQIEYNSKKGLKLLRHGKIHDRFDTGPNFHYNSPPTKQVGTWASVYPFDPYAHIPTQHDGVRTLDIRDQSAKSKQTFANPDGDILLTPIVFYWKFGIYSHIDFQGTYQNKNWTYYKNTGEFYKLIQTNPDRLVQSVQQTIAKSQNVNFPNSDIRYFQEHQWEVYVPHE